MTQRSPWSRIVRPFLDAVRTRTRSARRPAPPASEPRSTGRRPGRYAGDFVGVPQLSYDPHPDEFADPGEVVWAWVPYEEDASQGKDRPVLVIGRDTDAALLLALPLTSRDHHRDAAQERRAGRIWVDIGTGAWDREGRPSEVRVNRILRLDASAVRRIGAALDRARFEHVAAAVRAAAR